MAFQIWQSTLPDTSDFGFNARYKVQYPAAYWVDRSGNDSGFTEPWWQVQQVEEWTTVNTGQ
jgi:hypothetical protein